MLTEVLEFDPVLERALPFHINQPDLRRAHIFHGMGRHGGNPGSCRIGSGRLKSSAVGDDIALVIVTQKVAGSGGVDNARPAMGVNRSPLSGRNPGFENADLIVFH